MNLINIVFVIIFSLLISACSSESISLMTGLLEEYNQQSKEKRYFNNLIKLEESKKRSFETNE